MLVTCDDCSVESICIVGLDSISGFVAMPSISILLWVSSPEMRTLVDINEVEDLLTSKNAGFLPMIWACFGCGFRIDEYSGVLLLKVVEENGWVCFTLLPF